MISARFPPQRCGVGDYTCFLGCALARLGHDVHVLTAVGSQDELLYPLPANVHIHRTVDHWGAWGVKEVIRNLRQLDPDVLLMQYSPHAFDRRGITFTVNLLPALVRVRRGLHVITNFHELYVPFDLSLKRNLGGLWQRAMASLLAAGSNTLCVTATEWQRRLRRISLCRPVHLIPVGSNIPKATFSDEDRVRLRREVFGDKQGILLAGLGAQHDRDIPGVLHSLQVLKGQVPAKLIWIGGGKPVERHRIRIREAMRVNGLEENDVEWTGELPHPEISKLLTISDLMILPFSDGLSVRRTSAVTAFQHGLPLLSTMGAHIEPMFVHGQNVYLVPVGDRKALTTGLMELALRPELRTQLSKQARGLYDSHFTWESIAEQVSWLAEDGGR